MAAQLGVCEATVINWETGLRRPRITYYPAIIGFLGFDPSRPASDGHTTIDAIRRSRGLSQRELARRMGVDEGTLCDFKRGTRRPSRRTQRRITSFLTLLARDSKPR